MKQKVALGCTLARETPVLCLDEPMLGLDVETSRDLQTELQRLAREEDKTIVITSHDMDVIEAICDRVIVLSEGDIVANDFIENLLDVFQTQSYRVQLAEEPSFQVRDRLDTHFQLLDWQANAEQMEFEIELGGSDDFYDCVDVLRSAGVSVQSFTEIDPDLEDTFVTLTTDSDAPEEAQS